VRRAARVQQRSSAVGVRVNPKVDSETVKRGEEVSGKEGPIVERIRSKGGIRRQGGVKASDRVFVEFSS